MNLIRPTPTQLNKEFDHFREIVLRTYTGLTEQQAYDLAYYDNLETSDPLGRCQYYRGTDQRDFFIPRLKALFGKLPNNARIADIGAGDGQTTAMALDAVPGAAVIDIIEPSPAIKAYEAMIATTKNLSLGMSIRTGLGRVGSDDALAGIPDNSLDAALCLHAIYFFDISSAVQSLYRKLKPGAALFIVFADETRSTTGKAITGYFNRIDRSDIAMEHARIFEERLQLLGLSHGASNIATIIEAAFNERPVLSVKDAASRFYADKFGNMAAFGLLSGLPFFSAPDLARNALSDQFNTGKILSILESLRDSPDEFDLGIVNEPGNPRHGMWTTSQPQKIVTITRPVI